MDDPQELADQLMDAVGENGDRARVWQYKGPGGLTSAVIVLGDDPRNDAIIQRVRVMLDTEDVSHTQTNYPEIPAEGEANAH